MGLSGAGSEGSEVTAGLGSVCVMVCWNTHILLKASILKVMWMDRPARVARMRKMKARVNMRSLVLFCEDR